MAPGSTSRSSAVLERTHGLRGLVTGLAAGPRYLYLAAVGVDRQDFLYLYRVDTHDDSLMELRRETKTTYVWKPSLDGETLYLARVSGTPGDAQTGIDLFDTRRNRMTRAVAAEELQGISHLTGAALRHGERLYVPCWTRRGEPAIAVLTAEAQLDALWPVRGGIAEIIGVRDDILLYQDSLVTADKQGISPVFYSLKEREEVRTVRVLQHLRESREPTQEVAGGAP